MWSARVAAPSLSSAVARRSGSVVVDGGSASPSSPPSPSSETTASWDRHARGRELEAAFFFSGSNIALLPSRAYRVHCIGDALPFSRVITAERRLACSVGQEEKSEREMRKGDEGEERGG
uniref:Uncharacterized protein n=1 Tax=Oryza nivara TaxID=4536 RepID=A0A0E0IU28_ORYNI